LGSFVGLWHLAWSLLVATGAAQWLLDWVFYFHFLNNPLHVGAFNLATAVALVVVTSMMGCVVGCILALMWNGMRNS